MKKFFEPDSPLIIVHGGAGPPDNIPEVKEQKLSNAAKYSQIVLEMLLKGSSAVDAANQAVALLEDDPLFNAGLGAALQKDGVARLTASLMDGAKQKFSGVMLVENMIRASELASELQNRENTVLGPVGVELLAKELNIKRESPVTEERRREWESYIEHKAKVSKHGTVGAVALDASGNLAAATSTGGNGANFPGRIGDVATVAGNYATKYAAISATGIGEQIVNDAVAARLEARVRDGMDLSSACERAYEEASTLKRDYAWICLDSKGHGAVCRASNQIVAAICSASMKEAEVIS